MAAIGGYFTCIKRKIKLEGEVHSWLLSNKGKLSVVSNVGYVPYVLIDSGIKDNVYFVVFIT